MKRANAFVVGLVAVLLALAAPPAAAERTRKPAVAARPVAAARVPAPVKKRGLPATVATVSAPTAKILTSLVPWPQGVRLPEEKGGVWRTTNHTEDLYSKPVVDAASEKAHDRALDEILDARRGDRSVLLIGGINLGGAPKHNPAHGSSSNFDKSKRVRGQLNLAVANEQLELRLVGGVPLEPGADVAELMKRLGQAPDSVALRVKRKDLELPKGARGLVLLDYYELTDDARVNGLLAKAKAQPHKVFDLLVDPVDVAAEAPRLQRIQRLLDARLPNLRLFTTRLAKAQQLQHRKIYNELIFSEIAELAAGGPTLVFEAMSGVVPQQGKSFATVDEVRTELQEYGTATVTSESADRIGRGPLEALGGELRDKAYPIVIEAPAGQKRGARKQLAVGTSPVVPAGGALEFRGIQKLQDLANRYVVNLSDWAAARRWRVRVRGQLFVATDRTFIDAVAHAIAKGGEAEIVVHNLRIGGADINQGGVERLVEVGAKVHYFDAKQIPGDPLREAFGADPDRKLHSKTFQVELVDETGSAVDLGRVSPADRAAWKAMWAATDYPDMPLGPIAVEGSANLSQAAKSKNYELRAMTVGDAKGTAEVVRLLHDPLYKSFSRPVRLARFVVPDGVPDLFRKPAARQTRATDPGVLYVAANLVYERESSELAGMRTTDHGNEIVKIGVAHGALAEAAGKLGVSGRSSEGIVVNPGTNFAGEPKQLGRGLWMFGVEPASAAAQPTIGGILDGWRDAAGKEHPGLVASLRGLEPRGQPVLVTFAAAKRKTIARLSREGLREGVTSRFQIRDNHVVLDVQEALKVLMPEVRSIGRTRAVAYLGLPAGGTRPDAAAGQILDMLPLVIEKLRDAGYRVDTIGDLEQVMRPGAHRWDATAKQWVPAGAAP